APPWPAPAPPPPPRPRGRAGGPRRARRAGYVAVGVASAAVAIGTLFVVGGTDPNPRVVPPVDMFANQHRNTAPYGGSATPVLSPSP
ncbi:anti-sigma factor, partial [Streptosporangium sp. NPDC048865]